MVPIVQKSVAGFGTTSWRVVLVVVVVAEAIAVAGCTSSFLASCLKAMNPKPVDLVAVESCVPKKPAHHKIPASFVLCLTMPCGPPTPFVTIPDVLPGTTIIPCSIWVGIWEPYLCVLQQRSVSRLGLCQVLSLLPCYPRGGPSSRW